MIVASIVLAGGLSSRLGREKCAEVIAGKSLIERVIGRLSSLSSEVLIVISQNQSRSPIFYPKAKTVVDIYPGKSSLGGIYTGLTQSTCFHNLAVACDMPFLNPELLRYMTNLSSDFDVVIPRIGDQMEPLHAVYSKNCIDHMERLLDQGDLKITNFFDAVRVRYVEEDELDMFDPGRLSFFNINSRADLERATALLEQGIAVTDDGGGGRSGH